MSVLLNRRWSKDMEKWLYPKQDSVFDNSSMK